MAFGCRKALAGLSRLGAMEERHCTRQSLQVIHSTGGKAIRPVITGSRQQFRVIQDDILSTSPDVAYPGSGFRNNL